MRIGTSPVSSHGRFGTEMIRASRPAADGSKGSRPISRVLCRTAPRKGAARGSHSSWPRVTPRLQPPTRRLGRASLERLPTWCCSGWRLPRFTPAGPRAPRRVRRDSSLWPCSSRRRAGVLPRIPLCGARTFLCIECDAAAAWPTPARNFTSRGTSETEGAGMRLRKSRPRGGAADEAASGKRARHSRPHPIACGFRERERRSGRKKRVSS